ncbi:MAG: pyruvate kinase [Candidatus Aenigmarchaeota archaeon]|nr:pyruvate kinase [Candidatus Aenigmarchaeota archaeon]
MPTEIIATLGGASQRASVLAAMAQEGMDWARLNFSHENEAAHAGRLQLVRSLNRRQGTAIKAMLDLKGHEVRVRADQPQALEKGQQVLLSASPGPGRVVLQPPLLLSKLRRGARILMDDGFVELVVQSLSPEGASCLVTSDCVLKPGKAVSTAQLPPLHALPGEDKQALRFAVQHRVEAVALSHVGDAAMVEEARALLGPGILIVSKIENAHAVRALREIIAASDAIMVARGDLGINLPLEEVPPLQEKILRRCRAAAIPAIVATQMLESLTAHARPTRAEANDVYTAVRQGASGVMLSAETAVGEHPPLAVRWMRLLAERAEQENARMARPTLVPVRAR